MKLLTKKKIKLFLIIITFFCSTNANAETMILQKIKDNGILVFTNGQEVFLRDVWLQEGAVEYLKTILTSGDKLKLEFGKMKTNRYKQLASYVYHNNILLQQALIQEGFAIFYASSNEPENQAFLAFEQDARKAGKGFWQNEQNITNVITANDFIHKKTLVAGKIHHIKDSKDKIYINFGKDYKKSFSIEVDKNIGVDFSSLHNKTVLARGFVKKYYSPFMTIINRHHIEVLE